MTSRTVSSLLAALLTINALIAAWLWYPGPDKTWLALLVGLMLPFWWGYTWLGVGRSREEATRRHYDVITRWILFAGVIFLIGLLRSTATRLGLIDEPDGWRGAVFVLWGILLILMGNRTPKMLMPIAQADEARSQSFRRFAGWALVMLGVAIVILVLFLPLESAKSVGKQLAWGSFVVLIAARIVWFRGPRQGPTPPAQA